MKQVIVIGGGAGGMMAAGRAAEKGSKVILLEKTDSLGNKLLITGKDRCNFTNTAPLKEFIKKFGKKGVFLYPAFYNFFSADLRNLFENLGIPSEAERGGRVFPVSDSADDVRKALLKYLKKNGVQIILGNRTKDILVQNGRACGVKTDKVLNFEKSKNLPLGEPCYSWVMSGACRNSLSPFSVVLCTGGMSYPYTGSTGDGYKIAEKLGHTLVKPHPALVPLETVEKWPGELSGLGLKNVNVVVRCDGQKIAEEFGDMLFTHFGVSGPIILTMSKTIGENLKKGRVFLSIDLKPALSIEKLDARIQRDFSKYSNKIFANVLNDLLPKSLIPVVVKLSSIPADKPVHSVTKEERKRFVELLKDLKIEISRTRPISEAIITSGGVALEEIDNRTMESKFVKGLYFAGEILDLDAPTGGYNLQMAFSTGYLAGESAAKGD